MRFYDRQGWCPRTVVAFYLWRHEMATRYGWDKAQRLLKHGWKIRTEDPTASGEDKSFGDPRMVDPVNHTEHTPYEAELIQARRDAGGGI